MLVPMCETLDDITLRILHLKLSPQKDARTNRDKNAMSSYEKRCGRLPYLTLAQPWVSHHEHVRVAPGGNLAVGARSAEQSKDQSRLEKEA